MQHAMSRQSKICGVPNMEEQQLRYSLLLTEGKVITQAQNPVGKKTRRTGPPEVLSHLLLSYFLGLGCCVLYFP